MRTELLHSQFIPINERGLNPIENFGDCLCWEYNDQKTGLVVGKPADSPNQILIGPERCVRSLSKAFNLLDALEQSEIRSTSVLIINNYYGDEKPIDLDLLGRFGVLDKLGNNSNEIYWLRYPGISPGPRYPVATFVDLFKYYEDDMLLVSVIYAGYLRHEWTHVLQKRNGLPVNSLWAERSAMSDEARLLMDILNSGRLNRLQEDNVAYHLMQTSKRISNYRNGRGFADHLNESGSNSDGTPAKNQSLHLEDFSFGY
ncbi:MAG TPA: hypothetical protein VJ227_04210 [Patescibacteria group bacterium]|nr:hypothetical protein [Patescibacteria group bacterium]